MQDCELFDLLEATADAAFAVAEEGRIRFWNAAAEKLFGYSANEALDRPCYELLQGRGTLGNLVCRAGCDPWTCAARGEAVPSFDLEVKLSSGQRRWVNMSSLFLRPRRGGHPLMLHLARDISAQKQQEQMILQMRELSQRFSALEAGTEHLDPISPLSPRQCDILRLFASGKESDQVARELKITMQSLRNHVHRINQALHTRTRMAAVIQAQQRHLI